MARKTLLGFFGILNLTIAFMYANLMVHHQIDEVDYSKKLELDVGIEEFAIDSLNEYVKLLIDDDCEILYAEKDEEILILVFLDSDGRLIANTTGVEPDRIAWISAEGKSLKTAKEFSGFSFLTVKYPKLMGDTAKTVATTRLPQGFVFVPSNEPNASKFKLSLFLDSKKHRTITCHLQAEQNGDGDGLKN